MVGLLLFQKLVFLGFPEKLNSCSEHYVVYVYEAPGGCGPLSQDLIVPLYQEQCTLAKDVLHCITEIFSIIHALPLASVV